MRAIFKTEYDQDIRLFKHSGYAWSYGALLVLVFLAPLLVGSYLQSQLVFVFIVEEIAARWESVTNGNEGMRVKALDLFGLTVGRDGYGFYVLCLVLLIAVTIGALNLLRSPTGRAFLAIRDSETAARSMG